MEFRGKAITLRELAEEYFDVYLGMFSESVRRLLHVSDDECERSFLAHRLAQHERREVFFFCIFDNEQNRLIGAIELRNPNDSRGQLGSWINEKYWGDGRYQEALKLITDAYFERTGVLVVTAHVDMGNMRSYRALKKFGFIDIATIDGHYGKQYVLAYKRSPLSIA